MDAFAIREMVGFEIRNAREAQNLTLQQLASMSGTSYTHLWKVENAQVSVGLDLLCRIAMALDLPLDSIVGPAWEKAAFIEATFGTRRLLNAPPDSGINNEIPLESPLVEA